jgi:hypothetical protein
VIKKGKAGTTVKAPPTPPGIAAQRVDPCRRVLVLINSPTKDRIDCIKVSRCINECAQARRYPYRVVAIYGNKGGDMSLHLNVGNLTETMWNMKRSIEQGLMDAGIVGFSLGRD